VPFWAVVHSATPPLTDSVSVPQPGSPLALRAKGGRQRYGPVGAEDGWLAGGAVG
jgi:hypothetical protein